MSGREAAGAARFLIALIFLASGTVKLIPLDFEVVAFERWGYPMWFMTLTGVLEVVGAVGTLIPRLSVLSCFALSGLMVGALVTHLANAEWPMAVAAIAILGLSAWSGWARRDELRRLIPS